MGHVLLIDSTGDVARLLSTQSAMKQHRIDRCGGGIEALMLLRGNPPDVVVTDPAMPMAEGLALVQEFSSLRPGVRMILLAPATTPEELITAAREDVFACFGSPFAPEDVTYMIRLALQAPDWRAGIDVISGLPNWFTMRVSCHLLTAERLVQFMTEYQRSLPGRERDLLIAAFREMLLNAMEYGAGFDPRKTIEVTAAKTARAIVYHFRDPGDGFDRGDLAHAARSDNAEDVLAAARERAGRGLRPGGFGMLIVQRIADELVYNERGNEVLLIKHLR